MFVDEGENVIFILFKEKLGVRWGKTVRDGLKKGGEKEDWESRCPKRIIL